MTLKRKILLPILAFAVVLCVLSSVFIFGTAKADVQFSFNLQSEYSKGVTITLPDGELDGQKLDHFVSYPDGRTSGYKDVKLDTVGVYSVAYYKPDTNTVVAEKTFNVNNAFSGLFTLSDGVEIVPETDIPDYINLTGNTVLGAGVVDAPFTGRTSGVKFKVSKNGAKIDYNGIIDLNELNCQFGTSISQFWLPQKFETHFIEFLITPEDNKVKEFNHFQVTLTDVYDASNYLTFDVWPADRKFSSMTSVYIAVSAKGMYEPLGIAEDGRQGINTNGGATRSTFYGQVGTCDTDNVRLYFDMMDNSVYRYPTTTDRYPAALFKHFADPSVVGLENLWYGFTTGEVYLSIMVDELLMNSASFMLMNVGGRTLDSDYSMGQQDVSILVDYGEYKNSGIPSGVAGTDTSYPIFKAIAHSKSGGVLSAPESNVYYRGADGTQNKKLVVYNGRFKTENAGVYTIEYISESVFGKATKTVNVNVLEEYAEQDRLSFSLDLFDGVSYLGDKVFLYDVEVDGGIGGVSMAKEVYFSADGVSAWEKVETVIDGLFAYFVTSQTGSYKVVYTATDELGASLVRESVIGTQFNSLPVIEQVNIPAKMIKGKQVILPIPNATFIDAQGEHQVEVKAFIGGVDYTGKAYTVDGDFAINYKAIVKDKTSITSEVLYNVQAVDVSNDSNFYKSYFVYSDKNNDNQDDYTFNVDNSGIYFSTNVNGATFKFINSLPDRLLNFSFAVPDSAGNVEKINMYVTDSVNPNQKIKLSVLKVYNDGKQYAMLAINDQITSTISGSFADNEKVPFTMSYDSENFAFYDANGKNMGLVKTYVNGLAFKGFTSGMVYLQFETELNGASGTVRLISIGGQSFNAKNTIDKTRPQFVIKEDVSDSRFAKIGQTFNVPKAEIYDFLSNISEFKCVVETPSGNDLNVDKFDGSYTFTVNEVGTYVIAFSGKDAAGNRLSLTEYYIIVQENNPPIINLSENLKLEYSVGDKLNLPEIIAEDDTTEDCMVICYLEEPDLNVVILNSEYKFSVKGEYNIYVYAYDEFYNFTINKYTVKVK